MDRTLTLLLLALFLTWLAWRAARRQALAAQLRREAELEPATCTLEPVDTAEGRGFIAILPGGERSDDVLLMWEKHGVEVVRVEDFPPSDEARASAAFNAGADVELIADDDGAAVWVWDTAMSTRAGRLPVDLHTRIDLDDVGACVVVWEELSHGRRTAIDLLLVHRDMILEG